MDGKTLNDNSNNKNSSSSSKLDKEQNDVFNTDPFVRIERQAQREKETECA